MNERAQPVGERRKPADERSAPPSTLPFRLDPDTMARCFANDDVLRERIATVASQLAPHAGKDAPHRPDEFDLRLELVMLHLSRGNDVRAAGENAIAELRAGFLPGRKKIDRVVKQHARHLARLGNAVFWQWQGRYVHSTLLYLELDPACADLDRRTQALTCLLAGTNEADQRLWVDAAEHFERALLLAGCGEPLPDLRDAAHTGLRGARRHLHEDAA